MRASSLLIFVIFCHQSVSSDECGRPPKFHNAAGLVVGGVTAEKNKFPFLATLFSTITGNFFCGGTLLSNHHILTAAHCFQPKLTARKLEANKIVAFLGKYDLNSTTDRFVYPAYPSEVILHEDWNPNDPVYDADIAMLYIQDAITFRYNIYSACLLSVSAGSSAIMVGYGTRDGQSLKEHSNVPREALITFVSLDECRENRELSQLVSHRTICGGGRGQASPCRGDSGSGLYIRDNDKWHLRALVSSSLLKNDGSCDRDNYAVFTDVTKYTAWIRSLMGQTMKLKCNFVHQDNYYQCMAVDLKIESGNVLIGEATGNQLSDRNNNDITGLFIRYQHTPYLPVGINAIFPNLLSYLCHASGLKFVSSANFAGLRKLMRLDLAINEIEELPSDIFISLKRLTELHLSNNKIKALDRDLFVNNPNLRIIYIYNNAIEYLDSGLFRSNANLEQLHIDYNKINEIGTQFFDPIPYLHIGNFEHNTCVNTHYPGAMTLEKLKAFVRRNCRG